jgi:hypothetical protein
LPLCVLSAQQAVINDKNPQMLMTLIMSEGGLIQFHSRCNFGQSTRNVKRSSRSIQSRPLWDHFFVDEQHQDHHTLQKSVLNKMINFNREALVICESKLCTT